MYLATESEVARVLAGRPSTGTRRTTDGVRVSLDQESSAVTIERLREAFGPQRVVEGGRPLAAATTESFVAAGATVATAESCTGGLVAKLLTDRAGASRFFRGGVVAYANEAKSGLLGVPAETIARHGAVSGEVVEAMARGAAAALGADYAAAVSGVAGPDGGTPQKPVGTVWIGVCRPGGRTETRRYLFAGGRGRIRTLAAMNALLMLREALDANRY